jgi:hypothetical protein
MSLSHKHLAAVLLTLSLGCIDRPLGPSGETTPFRITPILPAGTSLATFNLVIDSVFVEIYVYDTTGCEQCEGAAAAPGGSAALQTAGRLDTVIVAETFYWDPDDQFLPLTFELPEIPPHHAFQLYLEMSAGPQIIFYGYQYLEPVRGRVVLPPIDVYYIGPGYLADSVAITQGDTVAQVSDTLHFDATAFQGGVELDTVYIGWRTTDTSKARITYTGELTFLPAMAGSSVGVVAMVPNTSSAFDTVFVTAPAAATAIERTSGHDQTAPAQTLLPAPIRARVLRSGGLPNAGIAVRFFPLGSTGTTVTDSIVITDSLGYAETGVILGNIVGGVDVEAFVVANTSIKTAFHATIGNAVSAPILYVSDSFSVTGNLRRVLANGSGRATVLPLNPAGIQQALPRWAPNRLRAAYSAYNGNLNVLWITKASGDSSAGYVNDISAYRPRYSPDGTHLAFQCGSIQDDEQTGAVCTGGGVTGAMNGLTGGGNAGSRVLLTDKVATRPDGPTSYAWNPAVPGRIAIVRDSTADTTGYQQSAIYRIDRSGTGLFLLSAPVMSVGNGPLKVVGPMDWSPDGTRIVFSARDPNENESSLYLLTVATGAVTRLTTAPQGSFGDNGDRLPVFSPNGTEVLFLRVDYSGDGMEADWHVVKVNGGAVRQVGYEGSNWSTSDLYALAADWSPDGQTLLLPGVAGFYAALYLVPSNISTVGEYNAQRVLIGDADGLNNLTDQGGSWRP